MSFLNGLWQIATEKHVKAPWSGGAKGKYFRCAFCGYKFQVGDPWRCQYTNNVQGAGGNPLVCKNCDEYPDEYLIEKWKKKCCIWTEMHNINGEWWWFSRDCHDEI